MLPLVNILNLRMLMQAKKILLKKLNLSFRVLFYYCMLVNHKKHNIEREKAKN